MGVEVNTARVWARAEELELSRVVFVNMLDRERADFYRDARGRCRTQLSDRCVAIQLPIGSEHELTGVVDLLHNCAYLDPGGAPRGRAGRRSPTTMAERRGRVPREAARRGRRDRRGADGALPRRRGARPARRSPRRSRARSRRDELYPVACGVATKNLGTHALLDLLVEGVPSPARKAHADRDRRRRRAAFVFKTVADPFAGQDQRASASTPARSRPTRRSSTSATTRRSGSAG